MISSQSQSKIASYRLRNLMRNSWLTLFALSFVKLARSVVNWMAILDKVR